MDFWEYQLTQGYGPTDEPLDGPYAGYAHFNKGLDFGVPLGTPIRSPISGTVISVGDVGDGWGTRVWVQDANGYIHNFGHLGQTSVQVGQAVTAGELVGLSGNTGASTGPHVSYDVWDQTGAYIDPSSFIQSINMPPPNQTPKYDDQGVPIVTGTPAIDRGVDTQGIDIASAAQQAYTQPTGVSVNGSAEEPFDPEKEGLPPGTKLIFKGPAGGLAEWTSPDGTIYQFRLNPQGSYDVNGNLIPAGWVPYSNRQAPSETEKLPQGAISADELSQKGADFSRKAGVAYMPDGSTYIRQPDGSYKLGEDAPQQTISGSALSALFPDVGLGNVSPLKDTSGSPAQAGSVPNGPVASSNPAAKVVTSQDVLNAQNKTGIQKGELMGSFEPGYTGLNRSIPVTYGGVFSGGGLTPAQYPLNFPTDKQATFMGRIPADPTHGTPEQSIGVGFNPSMIGQAAGLGNVDANTAMNIMTLRQQAADKGLVFPDLQSIQGQEKLGQVPKGTYKEALAKLNAAVGSPLDPLGLLSIPDPMPYQPSAGVDYPDYGQFQSPPQQYAHGGQIMAGMNSMGASQPAYLGPDGQTYSYMAYVMKFGTPPNQVATPDNTPQPRPNISNPYAEGLPAPPQPQANISNPYATNQVQVGDQTMSPARYAQYQATGFAHGGQMQAVNGPMSIVDQQGKVRGVFGEAGPEVATFTPMSQPQTGSTQSPSMGMPQIQAVPQRAMAQMGQPVGIPHAQYAVGQMLSDRAGMESSGVSPFLANELVRNRAGMGHYDTPPMGGNGHPGDRFDNGHGFDQGHMGGQQPPVGQPPPSTPPPSTPPPGINHGFYGFSTDPANPWPDTQWWNRPPAPAVDPSVQAAWEAAGGQGPAPLWWRPGLPINGGAPYVG